MRFFIVFSPQEEAASPQGSDKVADEEGEDLEDEEEYDEEEEEDDDDRPRKKPRHGGYILDEAGKNPRLPDDFFSTKVWFLQLKLCFSSLWSDVDDEYEDEEDQWEEGAEDILEKGEGMKWLRCKEHGLLLISN